MILAWRAVCCAKMSTRAVPPCCKVLVEMALLGKQVRCAPRLPAGWLPQRCRPKCRELPEYVCWHWDEGAMVGEKGHQHLLGNMRPAPRGWAGRTQHAMRLSRRGRMAVYSVRAAAFGSVLSGMPGVCGD